MRAHQPPLTVPAQPAEPYLHLDNRGLVVFDGRRAVMFPAAALGWVAETIELLLEEKRATRRLGDHVFGGFLAEDGRSATLYAGPADYLATLRVDADALRQVQERVRGR